MRRDQGGDGAKDANEPLIVEYRYNGLNRRIAKLVPNGGNWNRTDYYYNQSWQCLEERYGQNQAKETVPTAVKVQWLWDIRYIDAPVLRWRDTGGDPDLDETLYFCNDANMNVTALVNASTGNVVERYQYGPYGKVMIYDDDWSDTRSSSSYANEILYCGYRFDSESGLYHVRTRPYHPTIGRMTVRDFGGYVDGMTLYEYAVSSPADLVDPFGSKAMREKDFIAFLQSRVDFSMGSPRVVKGDIGAECNSDNAGNIAQAEIEYGRQHVAGNDRVKFVIAAKCRARVKAECKCSRYGIFGITLWTSYYWEIAANPEFLGGTALEQRWLFVVPPRDEFFDKANDFTTRLRGKTKPKPPDFGRYIANPADAMANYAKDRVYWGWMERNVPGDYYEDAGVWIPAAPEEIYDERLMTICGFPH